MANRPWIEHWVEHYFADAKPVSENNPLFFGWCVYIEVYELD